MIRPVRHRHSIRVAENTIHPQRMVQHPPAFGRIFTPAGHKKRTWSHQRMEFMQVAALLSKPWIESMRWILRRHESAFSPRTRMPSQIPRLPVVDAGSIILKDDPRVRPSRTGKFVEQAGREHRPLAPEGVTRDSNPLRIHLRLL